MGHSELVRGSGSGKNKYGNGGAIVEHNIAHSKNSIKMSTS